MADKNSTSMWRGRFFRYAPLFILTAVILLSSGYATMSETSRFIGPLLKFLFPAASPEFITFAHGLIRKAAHPCVYALLGFLASRAFFYSSHAFLRRSWHLFALIFVFLVATIDEIQQSFVPTRTGIPSDVVLDLAGATVAVVIFYLLHRNDKMAALPSA
jgi:VanZ family protein